MKAELFPGQFLIKLLAANYKNFYQLFTIVKMSDG